MKTIAFVTCTTKSAIAPNDVSVAEILQTKNIKVIPTPWDDPKTEWGAFDLVVLRSCWNYHLQPNKFEAWLIEMEKQRIPVCNSPKTVRWNMHKGYLKELSEQGVTLAPTVWLKKGAQQMLADLLRENKWTKAVVKPAVSTTAFHTILVGETEATYRQNEFQSLLDERDLLAQRFMPEVQEAGEWSLLFFDKQFSHAVLKKPKQNDFRVQNDFGGTHQQNEAPAFAIEQAQKILEMVKEPLLYTRVDGIISNGKFVLMELELIEPVLFLAEHANAASRFANIIQGRLETI